MSTVISILWALSIPATLVAAIWTKDLRWAATTIILVGCLVLLNMLPKMTDTEDTANEDKP
jgi:predicted membrane channel-forming protein YqfA (hemolysin III family)